MGPFDETARELTEYEQKQTSNSHRCHLGQQGPVSFDDLDIGKPRRITGRVDGEET
jgi:hypothetical protein